jgi:hypothetical protein
MRIEDHYLIKIDKTMPRGEALPHHVTPAVIHRRCLFSSCPAKYLRVAITRNLAVSEILGRHSPRKCPYEINIYNSFIRPSETEIYCSKPTSASALPLMI